VSHSLQPLTRRQRPVERGQELGVDVLGLPERQRQLMVRPDLFRQHPDIAETDAELIVAGASQAG
jgi:hypothetical protein